MSAQDLDWNELRIALAVFRSGSLSAAARALGVNHSTVFRRVRAIEARVGTQLFDRLPNGYVATVEGEAVRDAAERIETEVLNLSRELTGRDLRPRGLIRVAGPDALTLELLMPLLARFRDLHPEIELEVATANGFADLARREADIVVRSTTSPPQSAVGRKLCTLASTFYATPAYTARFDDAAPFDAYEYLLPDDSFQDFKPAQWLHRTHPTCVVVFRSNTLLALQQSARLGMGVAPLPCFVGDADTSLRRLRPPQPEFASQIWLLTHSDLRHTARIRALMDFLGQGFAVLAGRLEGRLEAATAGNASVSQ